MYDKDGRFYIIGGSSIALFLPEEQQPKIYIPQLDKGRREAREAARQSKANVELRIPFADPVWRRGH